MSAIKYIACLGVYVYLNLSKNPWFWTDTESLGEKALLSIFVLFPENQYVQYQIYGCA